MINTVFKIPLSLLLFTTLIFSSFTTPAPVTAATKMLMMNPLRFIFDGKKRYINAHVINNSDEPITYEIALVSPQDNHKGGRQQNNQEIDQDKIKKMIRYSPRRATIGPKERQVVKLMVRKPKNLAPGEYITRLLLRPLKQPGQQKQQDTESRFNLDIYVNSTFPIIIQHGEASPTISLVAAKLVKFGKVDSGKAVELTLTRGGKFSSFGDAFITYTPADTPDKPRKVGTVQGIAIYKPVKEKTITVPLVNVTKDEVLSGTFRVDYYQSSGTVKRRGKTRTLKVTREFAVKLN